MFKILRPKVYINSVYNIDLRKLKVVKNIKGIIVDLDNTLVGWGKKEVSQEIIDWVKEVKKLGLKICIVSNTNSKRVAEFAKILNIPYHSKYFKQLLFSYFFHPHLNPPPSRGRSCQELGSGFYFTYYYINCNII